MEPAVLEELCPMPAQAGAGAPLLSSVVPAQVGTQRRCGTSKTLDPRRDDDRVALLRTESSGACEGCSATTPASTGMTA